MEIQRTCFHFFLSVYLYFKHILQLKYISFCTKAQINVVLRTDPPENGSDVSSVILLACQIYFFMSMSSLSSLGNQCWWKACWSNQKTGSCPPAVWLWTSLLNKNLCFSLRKIQKVVVDDPLRLALAVDSVVCWKCHGQMEAKSHLLRSWLLCRWHRGLRPGAWNTTLGPMLMI